MARYHGNAGAVYIGTGAGAVASPITAAAEWSLDMSTDRVDCTAFNDSNKQFVSGLENIGGSISGYWDDTVDTVYDAMQSTGAVNMYLYPSTSVATKYWYGPAWVDLSISTGVADAVKFSGTFQASGTWGQF